MSILVVGATGTVGGEIAAGIAKGESPVRALLRGGNHHDKAGALSNAGIEIVAGDLRDPATLAKACQGVETVVTTATSMPSAAEDGLRRIDHDGALALIDAAESAGVKRFVYVSYSGNIRVDSPLERAKRACEDRLLASKMEAILLRPSYFMEMWLSPMLGFDPAHGSVRAYGSGEGEVSFISNSNVAYFAIAAAMAHPTGKDAIIEMGGPEALSLRDVVKIFEEKLGKTIRIDSVPLEALQEQHKSSDPLQQTFAALMLSYAEGDSVLEAVANAQKYGVRLRSVSEYASGFVPAVAI
jgi:uncharacterized protein YbjT (DUF2867 family)